MSHLGIFDIKIMPNVTVGVRVAASAEHEEMCGFKVRWAWSPQLKFYLEIFQLRLKPSPIKVEFVVDHCEKGLIARMHAVQPVES